MKSTVFLLKYKYFIFFVSLNVCIGNMLSLLLDWNIFDSCIYIYIGYKKVCSLHLKCKKPLNRTYNVIN